MRKGGRKDGRKGREELRKGGWKEEAIDGIDGSGYE